MKFSGNGARVVDGNACTHSYFDNWGASKVGGSSLQNQANCAGDNISPWNDYDPSLVGAVALPAAMCNGGASFATFVRNFASPTIINATNCADMKINTALQVRTDVSIVSNAFTANNPGDFTSYDGGPHVLNFIVPDKVKTTPADAHCSAGQGQSRFSQLQMDLPMSGIIYSPCAVTFSGGSSNWTGQMQVGSTGNINALITYVPVGAPLDPVVTQGSASPTLLAQTEP